MSTPLSFSLLFALALYLCKAGHDFQPDFDYNHEMEVFYAVVSISDKAYCATVSRIQLAGWGYFLNPTDLFGVASETINCTDTSSTICEKENCMHNNEPRFV